MNRRHALIVFSLVIAIALVWGGTAFAKGKSTDTRQLVEKSRMTFENFLGAGEMEAFRNLLKDARGVFIAPQVLKGAFVIGASGGTGVFVVKDASSGQWVGPAFYTIGEVSFGLQAGGQASEVIFLAMTERGVTALLNSSVKLGADVGVAAGPVGMGAAASTANLSADIITFARSKGLFGGISLDGAVIKVRDSLNKAYYKKKKISPTDILVRKTASNSQAKVLTQEISKGAAK
jgi:lipid-binding SYLF domain-containing protein